MPESGKVGKAPDSAALHPGYEIEYEEDISMIRMTAADAIHLALQERS